MPRCCTRARSRRPCGSPCRGVRTLNGQRRTRNECSRHVARSAQVPRGTGRSTAVSLNGIGGSGEDGGRPDTLEAKGAQLGGPIARCAFFCLIGVMRLNSEVRLEPLQAGHAEGMFEGLGDPAGYLFLPGDPPIDLASLRVRYARQIRGHSSDGTGGLVELGRAMPEQRCAGRLYAGDASGSRRPRRLPHLPSLLAAGSGNGSNADDPSGFSDEARPRRRERAPLVDTRNEASIALLRKLGFDLLGTVVGADHFKGPRQRRT